MAFTVTLISIVTPTFPGRETELLERCVPSVAMLDWPDVEHVIVSDRNPYLRGEVKRMRLGDRVRFVEINETWRNPITERSVGAVPWQIGSRLALGDFIGWLGDDDELHSIHVKEHVTAMRDTESMWSLSKVEFRVGGKPWTVIGDDSYELGHLDATGIMCHASALAHATWDANGENAADWRLVRDWRQRGLRGVFVDKVTGVHHDGWAAGKSGRPGVLNG